MDGTAVFADKEKKPSATKTQRELRIRRWQIISAVFFIPVVVAAFYYFFIASDIYVSETQFSVYSNDDMPALDALGSLGLEIDDGKTKDLLVVKEYILSREILKKLEQDINIKTLYQNKRADFRAQLSSDPSAREFLNYYRNMVDVDVFREASLLSLRVKAFTAEDSQIIANAILKEAEAFINTLSVRIKTDSVTQAESILKTVEADIVDLKRRIASFRQENEIVDPLKEVESRYAFITSLEGLRAQLIAKRSAQGATMRQNSFAVQSANKEIGNLSRQIEQAKANLVKESGDKSEAMREFEILMLEDEFMRKKYELALFNLEEAYRNSQKQNKYIVTVVSPSLPDFAEEPKRMLNVLSVLLVMVLGLGLFSLTVSSIKDHMV